MHKCLSNKWVVLSAGGLLAAAGCQPGQDAGPAAKETSASKEAAQLRQRRRERGDTLALTYKVLQQYLPASPAGYIAAGDPTGENVNTGPAHYSASRQVYKKGGETLKVALLDYNAAAPVFAAATAMMNSGLAMEDDSQLLSSVDLGLPNTKSMESLDKKSHKALVALGVADRFLVTIEASGQRDIQLVESVAKSLPLKKLAEL